MKYKHNKKRNTAFLYEALISNLTKASIEEDKKKMTSLMHIIKKHFSNGSVLKKELDTYKSIYETKEMPLDDAKSIITEAKRMYAFFDDKEVFNAQTKLVDDVNKTVGAKLFDTYLPNYKDLASLNQIFSKNIPPKTKVLLEKTLVKGMTAKAPPSTEEAYDPLVIKTFSKAFNREYSKLTEGQKELITTYVDSLSDEGLQLKARLSEEIASLKEFFIEKQATDDEEIKQRMESLVELLDSYKGQFISERILIEVLNMQDIREDLMNND